MSDEAIGNAACGRFDVGNSGNASYGTKRVRHLPEMPLRGLSIDLILN
jgi:hypothetical protein